MKIRELKEFVLDPKKTIIDIEILRQFFLNNQSTRNKRRIDSTTAKARRIEKIGEQRFGKGWWK